MKGVSAQWNIFSLFQTPSIPLGRGFEKEKISGSAIRKNENNILGLKLVVQQKGSIIFYYCWGNSGFWNGYFVGFY